MSATTYVTDAVTLGTGLLLARLILGVLMAAHGSQKLFGWLGGYGIAGTAGFFGPSVRAITDPICGAIFDKPETGLRPICTHVCDRPCTAAHDFTERRSVMLSSWSAIFGINPCGNRMSP